ncbi:hypothetical protein DTU56_09295 [Salmonella enterica subsp. enterica serovar Muenchen]|uniref:Uncharacterized protein n=1 Tax=Salmonella muenchen TaxID=596 RepID=A0A5U8XK39_SALMU|nr:hypothetical protein [Salmonella enterica subsp. enterica serovar Muenchen]
MVEDVMMGHGAQGHIVDDFIAASRVFYRIRPSKLKPGQRDMVFGHGSLKISYMRVNVGKMLAGLSIVVYNPQDPPQDIVSRTLHLSDLDDLKISPIKYDKKRRKHFIVMAAKRGSNVYVGGGRIYMTIVQPHEPIVMSREFAFQRK